MLDRHTYRITLKGAYPQFLYWLSMPFFSPVPPEADRFFSQPGMAERNLMLDWWPIGTGPYMLVENNPNARMVLRATPTFAAKPIRAKGRAGRCWRRAAGRLWQDHAVYRPAWSSRASARESPTGTSSCRAITTPRGVSSDNFDQAVTLTSQGEVSLSEDMESKGIRLLTSVSPSIFYLGFNMLDPLVGGGPSRAERERARRLRQAISIGLDMEEFVSIFLNGRGVPGMSPIPPGIFGAREGRQGLNPVVYEWRGGEADGRPVRRGLDDARRLLAEAGWPNGRHAQTGEPLVINLDTTPGGLGDKARSDWLAKRFRELGVQFVVRLTDFNRFQDKIRQGSAQLFFFGWNADYPDPENLLFLLHGPQGKVKFNGQNAANYENPEYDALFEKMKAMPDGPARQEIIDRMVAILQQEAPWIFAFHPKAYFAAAWLGAEPQAGRHGTQQHEIPAHRHRTPRCRARGREPPGAVAARPCRAAAGRTGGAGGRALAPARGRHGRTGQWWRRALMLAYLVRRALYAIPILVGVNLLTFVLFFVVNSPDDMARMHIGVKRATPEAIERWKVERGYDKPMFVNAAAEGSARFTDTIFFDKSLRMFALEFGRADDGRDIGQEIRDRMGRPCDRTADLHPQPVRLDQLRLAAGVLPRHLSRLLGRGAVRGDDVDIEPVLHHRRAVAGVEDVGAGADIGLCAGAGCHSLPGAAGADQRGRRHWL